MKIANNEAMAAAFIAAEEKARGKEDSIFSTISALKVPTPLSEEEIEKERKRRKKEKTRRNWPRSSS